MTDAFRIRPAKDDDLRHILASWVTGYAQSTFAKAIGHIGGNYPEVEDLIAKDIIGRGAKLAVANPVDDDWFIMGWVCWDPGVLHYHHVRSTFRGKGIEGALYAHAGNPKFATHLGVGQHMPQRDFIREAYKFALEKTCASLP